MNLPLRLSLLLLVGPLLAAGCATAYTRPEVTLQDVHVDRLGLTDGSLQVELDVMNPNVFTLNTEAVSYLVHVREADAPEDAPWGQLGNGVFDEPVTIAAKETKRVLIPVDFSYAALGSASVGLLRAKALEYRVTGTITALTPVGRRQIPFERKGLFDPRKR